MDVRNGKIALLSYLIIGCLGFGGLIYYVGQIQRSFSDRIGQVENNLTVDRALVRRPPVLLERSTPSQRQATPSDELEKLRELRTLLEERTKLLEQRSGELAKTTEEYQQLGEENDRYLALLTDLIMTRPTAEIPEENPPPEAADQVVVETDIELLEWSLQAAQDTIDVLEEAQLQQREVSAAVETAIVDSGELAIPFLMSVLADDRADLRIWATTLLGRLGPQASPALELLRVASSADGDPNVRRTATWAVRQIAPSAD